MDSEPVRIAAQGQMTLTDAAWEQAKKRAAVIGSLAAQSKTRLADADMAAAELGISRRQVYALLHKYRQGSGLVTDLAVRRSSGGKGGHRLPEPVEEIIRDLVLVAGVIAGLVSGVLLEDSEFPILARAYLTGSASTFAYLLVGLVAAAILLLLREDAVSRPRVREQAL